MRSLRIATYPIGPEELSLSRFRLASKKEVSTVDAPTAARLAADAIADKKGMDIVLLEVGDLFVITDFFAIATGTSRPHVQALARTCRRVAQRTRPVTAPR